MAFERVEPVRPQPSIRRNPRVKLTKRRGVHRVHATLSFDPHVNQPSFAQYPQVPRDTRLTEPELIDKLTHRAITIAEEVEHSAAVRLGEDLEQLHR